MKVLRQDKKIRGNLDARKIIEGATLYLSVFTHGAHLALVDLHAVMDNGEVCGAYGKRQVMTKLD